MENVNPSKGNALIRLTICCLSLDIRVFAGGVQPTSGPSRLLLSVSGLGSAHVSRARLQTHLRTTRSGTHTALYLLSVHLCLPSSPCLPPVLRAVHKKSLFLNAAGGVVASSCDAKQSWQMEGLLLNESRKRSYSCR